MKKTKFIFTIILTGVIIGSAAIYLIAKPSHKKFSSQKKGTAKIKQVKTTALTDKNYALAETQEIFSAYVKKIAAATNTNGVGVLKHNKKGPDPKDHTVMRINFDTIYSFAIIDLNKDLTLTMPETGGRYQSAWIITEEHYNPMAIEKPGTYTLTKENTGSPYIMIVIRTQANTADPDDLKKANQLQEKLKIKQKDRGSYKASKNWDMNEILKMRAKYMKLAKNMSTDVMFGKKGEVPLKEHNVGTATGWGGLTPKQAVYPSYFPTSTQHQTLTLKNVPIKAFWSVTVYDDKGFPKTNTYNINSQFAVPNKDGSVTINFGGDKNAKNYMEIFKGWNFTLRLYQPTEDYFNGKWLKPKLKIVK